MVSRNPDFLCLRVYEKPILASVGCNNRRLRWTASSMLSSASPASSLSPLVSLDLGPTKRLSVHPLSDTGYAMQG